MRILFHLATAAVAAFGWGASASAQSNSALTYFCDAEGFIRSDQTGQRIPNLSGNVQCPEAVLQGVTGPATIYKPEENRYIVVVVRSYPEYRGWAFDSYEWRHFFRSINTRYYAPHYSQHDYRDGYRDAIRDTRPQYSGNSRQRHGSYREQYGTWGGNRNQRSGSSGYTQGRRPDNSGRGRYNRNERDFTTVERHVDRNRGNASRTYERREYRRPQFSGGYNNSPRPERRHERRPSRRRN